MKAMRRSFSLESRSLPCSSKKLLYPQMGFMVEIASLCCSLRNLL